MATDRAGIFAGGDPFRLAADWLAEATATEPNDPNAMALATVNGQGLPNVRMMLLKEIESDSFVFYTNFESVKGAELEASGAAAIVLHWKSLRRQIRARGAVSRVGNEQADAYFASRDPGSRVGAWASDQSRPLESRAALIERVKAARAAHGDTPPRPRHWGGFRLVPIEIEFWADGEHRLHDRFRWTRSGPLADWQVARLYP